jgi:hypothetical protein
LRIGGDATSQPIVITGLVPVIHVLLFLFGGKAVDGRVKPGHDDGENSQWRRGDPAAAALHQPYGFGPFDVQAPEAHFRFDVTTGGLGGVTGGFGRGPGG